MSELKQQNYIVLDENRYTGLELQPESIWLQIAAELSSDKLAIVALVCLVLTVELATTTQLVAIVGIIGLGIWSSPLRWKYGKTEKATAAGSNESHHASGRERSAGNT